MNRQEAIDILSTHYEPDDQRLVQAFDMAIEALKEPHWIPCSERLPEDGKEVLVYLKTGFPYIAWRDNGVWYTEISEVATKGEEPTEWIPLPEPL